MVIRQFGRWLAQVTTATKAPRLVADDPPHSDQPICLIGDIHGRDDLLSKMAALIAAEPASDQVQVVTLGDMIDRGPDSAGVIDRLIHLSGRGQRPWISLMGNHERMMLNFLQGPAAHRQWLRQGGSATCASFDITGPFDRPMAVASDLHRVLAGTRLEWLMARPLFWSSGNIAAAHAGADPARPMVNQSERSLLWGHPNFGRHDRNDKIWVASGHVVVPAPVAMHGMIAVDTGAWKTGTLSAAWIDQNGLRFLQVSDQPKDRHSV